MTIPDEERREWIVLYEREDKPNELVFLTKLGRKPLTYQEARTLAVEYTQTYREKSYLVKVIDEVRLVSPPVNVRAFEPRQT